uniref:TfoX_N domain-containing protein n=1 Tax=Meloidogyne hapla TaxID=6305 RepID=A0A1I8BQ59_MELHA
MPIEELVRLVNLNTSIFEPLFDGHVIALFYLNNQETFRIHLRSKGLNFYDSKRKASYFVKKYEDKTKENFGDLYLELDTKKEAKKRETS